MDDKVFDYATDQLLGLRFEAFNMIHNGRMYVWPGDVAGAACRFLLRLKLRPLCRLLFYCVLELFS